MLWEDFETEPAPILAHSIIGTEEAKIGQRLPEQEGAGEVKGVQGSDWLDGECGLSAFGNFA
jgi:hypothetical protein